jgi:hypothetical protein
MPTDLDAATEHGEACGRDGEPSTARLILALVAELRAAREKIRDQAVRLAEAHEVVDAARSAQTTLNYAFSHHPEPAGGEPDAD